MGRGWVVGKVGKASRRKEVGMRDFRVYIDKIYSIHDTALCLCTREIQKYYCDAGLLS